METLQQNLILIPENLLSGSTQCGFINPRAFLASETENFVLVHCSSSNAVAVLQHSV